MTAIDRRICTEQGNRDRSCQASANIPFIEYNQFMEWNVVFDPDFRTWFYERDSGFQDEAFAAIKILGEFGPMLGRPKVDTLKGSSVSNMKELRIQYQGDPWRILFAFDPQRQAILLVGGNKSGNKRWYKENLPLAEQRYERYLETLAEE
jgi:hypothetical protein